MNLLGLTQSGGAVDIEAATELTLSLWEKIAALTLFGGIGWAIAVGVIFIIAVLWSDHSENGFAITFYFAALLGLFYFWGSAAIWDIFPLFSWEFLTLYFSIGLGYGILKTFLYFKRKAKQSSGKTQEEIWSSSKY